MRPRSSSNGCAAALDDARRDVRRAVHVRARRRRRRPSCGASARRATSSGRAPDDEPGRRPERAVAARRSPSARRGARGESSARSSPSSSRSSSRSRTRTTRTRSDRRPAAPKPFRIVFPEGFTAGTDGCPRARRRADRAAEESQARQAELGRVPARDPACVDPVLPPTSAEESRGVPVPGDLRLPALDDDVASSSGISWRPSVRTGRRSISPTRDRRI